MDSDSIAAVVVPISVFSIPVISILTRHQRKMAELIHGNPQNANRDQDLVNLQQEVAKLSSVVSTLAINMDNMNDKLNRQSEVQDRLKIGE